MAQQKKRQNRKPVSWFRIYRYSDDVEVSERPYGCYSAVQAVGYYVNRVLGDATKMDDYYAIEVDGPNGWRKPKPVTIRPALVPQPTPQPQTPVRPPRQLDLDLSGEPPVDF